MSRSLGHCLQVHELGLKQDRLEQLVDAFACLRRDVDEQLLAAPLLRNDFMLRQFVPDAFRIGILAVDLVNGNDQRNPGCLRVFDGFDSLRHDAVVRRNNEDDDVGGLCATGAHGRKRGMARCIEERDPALVGLDRIGADMLGNTTRLAGRNVRAPDIVEQRRLAVVDVSHDRYDGRSTNLVACFLHLRGEQLLVDVRVRYRLGDMAEFLDHQRRRILVDDLVDRNHRAHVEQYFDDLVALNGKPFGEL